MSETAAPAEPRYMGGQAVLEGVMMRGATTWAVAVRDLDGAIKVDVREVPGWAERYRNVPVVRGVMGLVESLGLGYRALTWSANQQVPAEEQVSEKVMGWAVAIAAIAFSALFIVLPALAGRSLGHLFHGSFPLVEGIARLGARHEARLLLGGLGLRGPALEALDPATGVYELLLAGVEGMALRAQLDAK